MPVLTNAKHERFAQLLADGKTATEAYELAGYKPHRGNASTLAQSEEINSRVEQIRTTAAVAVAKKREITADSLIAQVDNIHDLAIAAGQYTTALNAVKEKGILSGQRIERSEQGLPGEFAALADDEVYAEIRQQAAELGVLLEEGATAH